MVGFLRNSGGLMFGRRIRCMAEADDSPAVLRAREEYARDRLVSLTAGLSALESLRDVKNLCVYATGSFGRLEASRHSDIDLFFVQTGDVGDAVTRIKKTLLDADIIRASRELDFPEF